jgi:hypothetical protein
MKKIFLLLTLTISFLYGNAQNNMQFNNAIHLKYNVASATNIVASVTVPANKVWKVESGSFNCSLPFITTQVPTQVGLSIDGQLIESIFYAGYNSIAVNHSPPIWLPAGTYDIQVFGANISSVAISILEFNLVP